MAQFDINFTPSLTPAGDRPDPLAVAQARYQQLTAGLTPPKTATATSGARGPLYSSARNSYLIGGREISARDEAGLLQAAQTTDFGVPYEVPQGDWAQVDTAQFDQMIGKIANPDFMTRMGKSFEVGAAGSGELMGAALTFAGLQEPGMALMQASQRRQEELSPYVTQFSDIGKDPTVDVIDWVASTVGQLGPSILETAVSALVGAGIGAASGAGVGSTVSAPIGAIAGIVGRDAFKKSLVEATELYAKQALRIAGKEGLEGVERQAAIKAVPKKQIVDALRATNEGQQALKVMRNAGAMLGGTLANLSQSYLTGVGDITADQLASGRDPAELDRFNTLWQSAVYAGIEVAPDVALARSLFGSVKRTGRDLVKTKETVDLARNLLSKTGTVAAGVGKQGALEGATEFGQELLLMAANPLTDWSSPEVAGRLTNSFAAGALMGGLMGGPANLLNRARTEADEAKAQTGAATQEAPPEQPLGPMQGPPTQRMLPPPPTTAPSAGFLPPPPGPANFYVGPEGTASPYQYGTATEQGSLLALPPPTPPREFTYNPPPSGVTPASVLFAGPAGEVQIPGQAPTTGPMPFRAPAPAQRPSLLPRETGNIIPYPAATPEQRAAGFGAAPEAAPFNNQMAEALAQAQRRMEAQSAAQQRNPLLEQERQRNVTEMMSAPSGMQLDITAADGNNATTNNGKRKVLSWFNQLTGEQQDNVLEVYANDLNTFLADVRSAKNYAGLVRQLEALVPDAPKITDVKMGKPPTEVAAPIAMEPKVEPKPKTTTRKQVAPKGKKTKAAAPAPAPQGFDTVPTITAKPPAPTPAPVLKPAAPLTRMPAAKKPTTTAKPAAKEAAVVAAETFPEEAAPVKAETPARDTEAKPEAKVVQAAPRPEVSAKAPERTKITAEDELPPTYYADQVAQRLSEDTETPNTKAVKKATDAVERKNVKEYYRGLLELASLQDPNLRSRKLANGLYVGNYVHVGPAGNLFILIDKDGFLTFTDQFTPQVSEKVIETGRAQTDTAIPDGKLFDAGGSGKFSRDDGTPIGAPMAMGRVKMLISALKSRMKIAPNTYVYRSIEDLKKSNPALYAKAKVARLEGDFDKVSAVGYSFGDSVIIFSDRIQTEKQLKFVLAHEALGHYGLRSLYSKAEVDKLLTSLYDNDMRVRIATDTYMEQMGIPKMEAIEEVLADNAAHLDNSLLARIADFIQRALNKVGISFGNEFGRAVVNQLRRYARYGEKNGTLVGAEQLMSTLKRLDEEGDVGRFSTDSVFVSPAKSFGWLASIPEAITGRVDLRSEAARSLTDSKFNVLGMVKDVLEAFQTPQNLARKSYGMEMLNALFVKMNQTRNMVLKRLRHVAVDLHTVPTGDPDLRKAEELFWRWMLKSVRDFKESDLKSIPDLVSATKVDDRDNPLRNQEAIDALRERIKATPAQIKAGFEFREGTAAYSDATMTKDSKAYKLYSQMVDTLIEQQIIRLESQIAGSRATEGIARSFLIETARASDATMELLVRVREKYADMMMKGAKVSEDDFVVTTDKDAIKLADEFAHEVSRVASAEYGELKLKDWLEGKEGEKSEKFRTAEFDDLIKDFKRLRELKLDNTGLNQLKLFIQQGGTKRQALEQNQLYAKSGILQHYTPLDRDGTHYVRVVAVDEKGDVVDLSREAYADIPYYEFADEGKARRAMADLNKAFGDAAYKSMMLDSEGKERSVRLVATVGAVKNSADMRTTVNPFLLIKAIENIGLPLNADAQKKLTTLLTEQGAAARRNLQRVGVAGFNTNIRDVQSRFSDFIASVSANNIYRSQVDDLFLPHNNWKWTGSRAELRKRQEAVDAATDPETRRQAMKEYAKYATQFKNSVDATSDDGLGGVTINGKTYRTLGRGNKQREQAVRMVDTLNRSGGELVEVSEAVFGQGFGGKLRSFAVLAQLGGSAASAFLQYSGLPTNSWAFMSYVNSKNGFGAGYGAGNSGYALSKAFSDTLNYKLADYEYLLTLKPGAHNLTAEEITFLQEATEAGSLTPAQADSLMGSAHGRNAKLQKAADIWMSGFNYAEQHVRRTTALAVFRLEYQRQLSKYGTPTAEQKKAAYTAAVRVAENAIDATQGRYGVMDRPELGRTGLLQYPFQYKQFVINSIELMANLSPQARLQYLAVLLMMTGVSGIFFAEDLMDIIDTLLSFFGIPKANVEQEMILFFDSMVPGLGAVVNKGLLDQVLNVSISPRIGYGDVLPFSGAGVPGTDKLREFESFLGPVYGALTGAVTFGTGVLSMPLELLGGKPETTSLRDLFRNSPVTALRSVGDSWAYLESGAIVTADGRLVSKDMAPTTVLMRLLGFYPAAASRQNDIVRMGKQNDAYRNEISGKFRMAYIRAGMANQMRGDRQAMMEVVREVEAWNKAAKGTGLEITNFRKNADKALKDAKMPTVERFLKSTGTANKPVVEQLSDALGF